VGAEFPSNEYAKLLNSPKDQARQRGLTRMLGRHPNDPRAVSLLIDAVTTALQDNTVTESTLRMIQVLGQSEREDRIAVSICWLNRARMDERVPADFTFQVIETLGAVGSPTTDEILIDLLEEEDVRLVILAVDALARRLPEAAFEAILKLVERPEYQEHYGFRFSVLSALAQSNSPKAIGFLVTQLPSLSGQLKFLVVKHLTRLTGQSFGGRAVRWTQWWSSQPRVFQPAEPGTPNASLEYVWDYPVPTYYGYRVYSTRLVFVIDISSTMRQLVQPGMTRLDQAKLELSRAIAGLPGDAMFNIVAFDRVVQPWQATSVPATAANKQLAMRAVAALQNGAGTAIFDGLDAAFRVDPETEVVYLLTDGLPTAGRVKEPSEILKIVTRANRFRKIGINTIAVGRDSDLLLSLSRANFGSYRRSR
jgi:hypothetical protein